MTARVTSVFLYVKDVRRSLEFYNEVVGAEIVQIHAENENAPYTLAILRIGQFTLMLHPQEPHAQEFTDTRVGVGIHLQMQVPNVDEFYQHCLDEGAILSVSGEPADQNWGWREFALRDPDGYVWSVYQILNGRAAVDRVSPTDRRRRPRGGRVSRQSRRGCDWSPTVPGGSRRRRPGGTRRRAVSS